MIRSTKATWLEGAAVSFLFMEANGTPPSPMTAILHDTSLYLRYYLLFDNIIFFVQKNVNKQRLHKEHHKKST